LVKRKAQSAAHAVSGNRVARRAGAAYVAGVIKPESHRIGANLALTLVAIELAVMFVGAILPTPLYPLFRRAFGFSGVTLTLIYAVYVLGNLVALLFFGRLADQIGRRNASLPAIVVGICGALAFAFATGTPWLFVARALSGFCTGLAAGAATAWIAELYSGRIQGAAARIAAAANFFGCAAGPLLGGLLAQFAPAPLRLPFFVFLVLLCASAGAICLVPETVRHRVGLAEVALKPRIGIPPGVRLQFLSPAVTGFAAFSLIGFYSALIPNLLADGLQQTAPLVAGLVVCGLFSVAAVAILTTGRLASQATMLTALALLPPAVWLLVGAQVVRSLPLLLVAAALGGIAGGLGYRGSLEVVNRIAPADRRSETVSSYLIALFAGNSVPVIGIGLLSAELGPLEAHMIFAAVITALAGLAFWTGVKFSARA
jgi:MFS family permease